MLMSFDAILQLITTQNLLTHCSTDSPYAQYMLEKCVSLQSIQRKIDYIQSATAIKGYSIFFIEYVNDDDEFVLRKTTIDKHEGQIFFVNTTQPTVKWIRVVGKEYVLMCSANDIVGNKLKHELPVIYKNS